MGCEYFGLNVFFRICAHLIFVAYFFLCVKENENGGTSQSIHHAYKNGWWSVVHKVYKQTHNQNAISHADLMMKKYEAFKATVGPQATVK